MDEGIKISTWSPETSISHTSPIRATFDLSFRDLSYTVGKGKDARTILHNINGVFRSGQLIAILGPSGAGKTSLMNILCGFKTNNIKGKVQVNGIKRQFRTFRKHSAYITQKDHLLSHLTVDEYMMSTAHLKLGNGVSDKEKKNTIDNVMRTLGLLHSQRTRVGCLSGGECKRLSIGLELIDNPAILFLDEPTSGLDSSSSFQCVALLHEIAKSGRTVITTIHQPNSRILDLFDHLYIIAGGSCMYQGPVASLLPFFQNMNLSCPSYHNPADFAMDVACGVYGDVVPGLVSGIENGRLVCDESLTPMFASTFLSDDTGFYDEDGEDDEDTMLDGRMSKKEKKKEARDKAPAYPASFMTQVVVLLKRSMKTIWREKILTLLRFILHVLVGVCFGWLYWQAGDDASVVFYNTAFLFFNLVFILFAAMMPTVATFPLEREVLAREHLNHWYSLKAYYLAKTMADIPFQIIFPTVYLVIVYLMSNQPMSLERFGMLLCMTIFMALMSQGIGFLIGAFFDIQAAVFIAPLSALPFFIFSGFFVRLKATPIHLSWIQDISFARYAFEGSMLSIYGYDRPPLTCPQPYCHFRNPERFLDQFDMAESEFYWCVLGQLIIFLIIRVAAYFVLRFKLKCLR